MLCTLVLLFSMFRSPDFLPSSNCYCINLGNTTTPSFFLEILNDNRYGKGVSFFTRSSGLAIYSVCIRDDRSGVKANG